MLSWNVEANGFKNRYERYFSALAQRNPIIVFHTYLCTCDISVCWKVKKNTLSTSELLIKVFLTIKADQIVLADKAQWSQMFCPSSGRVVAPIGGFRGTAACRPTTLSSVWSTQVGFYCLFCSATLSSARNPHSVFGDAVLKWSQVHSGRKH